MKKLLILSAFLSLNAISAEPFTECKVAKNTKMRMMTEVIKAGDIAVSHSGDNIGLKEILADQMIHFKSEDGKISESYQWMYSRINKVMNREHKFLSSSYGEDVIITVGDLQDKPGMTTIKYNGTGTGNYLTLICE